MSDQKEFKSSSIARNLAIWIGGFFLLAALLLLWWTTWLQRKDSLEELKNLARTNAAFVGDLGFPLSPQLASQLSNILDLGVGFYAGEGLGGDFPPEILSEIRELSKSNEVESRRAFGIEFAVAPLANQDGHLILIRDRAAPRLLFAPSFYIPAIALAFGCAALAFGLGRSIVRPLQILTRWLPNLKSTDQAVETEPISDDVLKRGDEVGALSRALLETNETLIKEKERRIRSERLAALGRIATSLAHEVKNPAAAIQMHADLLLEKETQPGDRESLELIRGEVDHITDLVNQWLFIAKSSPSKTSTHDFNAIISRVAQRIEATLDHADVDLSLQFQGEGPLPIDVDSLRIELVIRNLIQNALQAMPHGGTIEITTRQLAGSAEMVIQDQGKGFSDEALARFGEPFFSEREGGMGIGLSLSSEVLKSHGGKISPENMASGGARITVQLPLFEKSEHE